MSMLEGKSRGARDARKAEAEETMQIIEQGGYVAPDGTYVEIGEAIEEAVVGSYCYGEHEMPQYRKSELPPGVETTYDVVNARCVETAQALASAGYRCTMLNFASAKNPGGGFLGGAEAQEENIARSGALYPCLTKHQKAFYGSHRKDNQECLYSDRMIHSPRVTFFRVGGCLLQVPFQCGVITSPAPNAKVHVEKEGQAAKNKGKPLPTSAPQRIEQAFRRRVEKVLAVAASQGAEALVLGAWGCGVFGNQPEHVAGYFRDALRRLPGVFHRVVFAVYDRPGGENITAFEKTFGPAVDIGSLEELFPGSLELRKIWQMEWDIACGGDVAQTEAGFTLDELLALGSDSHSSSTEKIRRPAAGGAALGAAPRAAPARPEP